MAVRTTTVNSQKGRRGWTDDVSVNIVTIHSFDKA